MGALALSACTTMATTSTGAVISATPSLAIRAPLSHVACDATTCVAFGTQTLPSGVVLTEAQAKRATTPWTPVDASALATLDVAATACASAGCLVAGTAAQGADGIALFVNDSFSTAAAPTGGIGISAASCAGDGSCSVIDRDAKTGDFRLVTENVLGGAWSTPQPVSGLANVTVTGLSCTSAYTCTMLGTSGGAPIMAQTANGGITWSTVPLPKAWTNASSLQCVDTGCTVLATAHGTSELVRSNESFTHWRVTSLSGVATALSCSSTSTCAVIGVAKTQPIITTVAQTHVVTHALRYAPVAFGDLACTTSWCTAISPANVATFRF